MKKEYPYNLLAKAYGDDKFTAPLTEDQLDALQLVIGLLSEQMKQVLCLRYEKNLTLEKVGQALKMAPASVGNTDKRILVKLRHPENATKILYGLNGAEKINDDTLEHLGLSLRTYNALKRGGISKVSDIKSVQQLRLIRNIGEVLIQEVLDKLIIRGITLPVSTNTEVETGEII